VIGGDIVLQAEGIEVSGPADLARIREALNKVGPGEEIRMTVLRSGRLVELGERRQK
jgi:S1-C subfamily serine protease